MSGQHPVNWVFMYVWQRHRQGPEIGRKIDKLWFKHIPYDAKVRSLGYTPALQQIAIFPCRNRTDNQLCIGILDCCSGTVGQLGIARAKPDQRVGIKYQRQIYA